MSQSHPYEELTASLRAQAVERFLDAGPEDGFRYELDTEGAVLSRFKPTPVRGQPAPIYADGYLVHQNTD